MIPPPSFPSFIAVIHYYYSCTFYTYKMKIVSYKNNDMDNKRFVL